MSEAKMLDSLLPDRPHTPAPPAGGEPPADRLVARPMVTLPQPVGGSPSALAQMKWLEELSANYATMPDDVKDALILMQRAFPAGEGGMYYLTAAQSMMVVRYCRETQISVHADHWWFDPRNYRMGSTVAGQREEARRKGIVYSPPVFKQVTRQWPEGVPRIVGHTGLDFGVECTINTERGPAVQTAWYSVCAQGKLDPKSGLKTVRSGPWSQDPLNMLTIRSEGRALERVTGGSGPDADWADDTSSSTTPAPTGAVTHNQGASK